MYNYKYAFLSNLYINWLTFAIPQYAHAPPSQQVSQKNSCNCHKLEFLPRDILCAPTPSSMGVQPIKFILYHLYAQRVIASQSVSTTNCIQYMYRH